MPAALSRASTLYDAGATPLAARPDGAKGLFLVRFAPRLTQGIVEPGFVVVFVSELALRAAATDTPVLRLTVGGSSTEAPVRTAAVRKTFTGAGEQFAVEVPRSPVQGAAGVLPWIILAAGLVLSALAGALGFHAARRARAQDELDRIFNLSPDLVLVADFDGYITRVNPAVKQVLDYTEDEFRAVPYLDRVHPDDREQTAGEAAALNQGKATLPFVNRYVRKDGSYRVIEWTAVPVVKDRLIYAVGRDITERRQAETELKRLAEEQAALRHVAIMVARESPPEKVLAKVAEEVALLLGVDAAVIHRYEPDGDATVVGSWGKLGVAPRVGSRSRLDGATVPGSVYWTEGSTRFDNFERASLPLAEEAGKLGLRSAVGSPIIVNGRLWGAIAAAAFRAEPMPADAESRISQFTELVATAISNLQARSDLAASRARIVATADQERRRVVRDLHDGAQQRLVHTVVMLKLARRALARDGEDPVALVNEALHQAETATDELRELAHGILPSILSHGGLRPAVTALASRMSIPVETDISVERLPPAVEATAYFIVAEALTNVAKHAHAHTATVRAHLESRTLHLEVRDDGVGGAQPNGSGLVGLSDRLAVLNGSLRVDSPADGGTLITASIPVP
jgi:PAS domain S-box-containing protein